MPNPTFWRNLGLAIAGSGLASATAVIFVPDATLGEDPKVILACYALLAIIFGSMWTSWRHSEVSAQNALLRGEGVIVRWRVDPTTWSKFAKLNDTFSINECKVRLPAPPEGIEIIVGRHAILIDGYVHKLTWPPSTGFGISGAGNWYVESATLLRAEPNCANLRLKIPSNRGTPAYSNLVFPIAPSAESEALRVIPWTQ